MKRNSRILCVVLTLAFIVTCFAGCSGSGGSATTAATTTAAATSASAATTTAATTAATTTTAVMTMASATTAPATSAAGPAYEDHMNISIAVWNIGDMVTDEPDALRDLIYDKFNIEIEPYPVTWGDYSEKILLWASTASLPDMTAYEAADSSTFDKWTSQGVVRALPSLDNYPNVYAVMNSEEALIKNRAKSMDDPLYGILRPNVPSSENFINDYGALIRLDWMHNVGVDKVPSNVDELLDLCLKFQNDDPDGDGIKNTIAITGYDFGWMSYLMNGDCPAALGGFHWVFAEDGTLVPCWATKEFLEGMKTMARFYQAGVIDPDYIILSGEEGRDKFKNGVAGIYLHSGPYYGGTSEMYDYFEPKIEAGNYAGTSSFTDLIGYVPWFNTSSGHPEYRVSPLCWSETYLSSAVDDAKADRCLALMDWLLSLEGYYQCALGIEGVDYEWDANGKYVPYDLGKNPDGSKLTVSTKYKISTLTVLANWSSVRTLDNPSAYQELVDMDKESMDYAINVQGAKPANLPYVADLFLVDTVDFDTAGSDYKKILNDIMTADDVEAKWQETVNQLMANGYDKVIAEMNALYKAAGR